ncbi:MAG: extracellular solute-binding protein [Spirochaetales bacterium]|nr:extracellular solute-binding protein [Spirochaetales bacterium]
MKKACVLAAILCVLCAGPAFAGGQADSTAGTADYSAVNLKKNGPVEIDFWHIQATIYGDAVKEIVKEFNREYQGIIQVNEVFQGSYADLNKKIRAAIQGGGLPTVAMAYENDTLEYMKANVIRPLDPFFSHPEYGIQQSDLDDMIPGVLARQRIAQYDGKTMSWPHGNSSMGIYYNKDLLLKAGYTKPAATWVEFEKQAIDIYKKTGVPALAFGTGPYGNQGHLMLWMRTFGEEPISEDASSVNFNNNAAVELLQMMKRLHESGTMPFVENTEQEFTNQRSVFEISTTARTSTKADLIGTSFDWGITLIPQGNPATPSTGLWGGNHVLFNTSPEKELAAWVFMDYFAGTKGQAIYAAMTGYFPARFSSQETDILKKNYETIPQKGQAFKEVFPAARITTPTAAGNAIGDVVADNVMAFLNGQLTAGQASIKIQNEAEKALEQYR